MGGLQCCSGLQENQVLYEYQYQFGEDNAQSNIVHTLGIEAKDESVKSLLKECAERLKQSSKLYKDPYLKSDPLILKSSNEQDQLRCYFRRPYHFLKDPDVAKGKKYKILDQTTVNSSQIIIKNDALQYFSVFLCFLADNPNLIKDLILTQPNTYGIHAINMYIHGNRKPIYIDDYVLCYNDKPIFSQPVKGIYMWTCLLEKAWQKVKGYGSKKISITSPVDVFHHFFSYPFSTYSLSELQSNLHSSIMKKIILSQNQNRKCIVKSKKQPHHKIGLSGGKHFYLKLVFNYQGKTLYYLRNPCGLFQFRGFHSALTRQIEERIKKETNETSIAQGNFILQEDEFLQQIEQFFIIHYNKNSNIVSQQLIKMQPNFDYYFKFILEKEQQISISFIQEQMPGNHPFYQVTYQIISQKDNKIISGKTNEQGCFGIRSTNLLPDIYQHLPPGEYLIRIKKKLPKSAKTQPKNQREDRLVITGSSHIKIDYTLAEHYKSRFQQFLLKLSKFEIQRISSGSRFRGKDIQHGVVWFGDLMFVYIRKLNRSKPKINLEVSFPDQINLECINFTLKSDFTALQLTDDELLIIFQKRDLTEETSLGKYYIQTF